MKKTAVVTGAGGFIGANLVRRLLTSGYTVHCIVRKDSNLWRLHDCINKISVHAIGLGDKKQLSELWTQIHPKYIFHTAAYGAYPTQQNDQEMIAINVLGTLNLLQSLLDIPYDRFITLGSSSEYGKKDTVMKETDILEPTNMYAVAKAAQTHLCQVFAKSHQKSITILRLFNVYGAYEEKGRLVRAVIESVLRKEPVRLATGKEARDFILVDDVSDACIQAAQGDAYLGEVFNIGTGIQHTIKELAEEVMKVSNIKVPIELNVYPGRPWDIYRWQANMQKTNNVLHWKPTYSLAEGLAKTIAWYTKTINETT